MTGGYGGTLFPDCPAVGSFFVMPSFTPPGRISPLPGAFHPGGRVFVASEIFVKGNHRFIPGRVMSFFKGKSLPPRHTGPSIQIVEKFLSKCPEPDNEIWGVKPIKGGRLAGGWEGPCHLTDTNRTTKPLAVSRRQCYHHIHRSR